MSFKVNIPITFATHILIYLLLICSSAYATTTTTVGGRVFTKTGPLKGAQVYIYDSYNAISEKKEAIFIAECDERGFYNVRLPKGEYYFLAQGMRDGKNFSAFHGNNPIKVETEDTWITLLANEVKQPVYSEGDTGLAGIVTYKGIPLNGAYVSLYKSDSKKFKGLGFRTESVGENGTFRNAVPSGNYVVIAKKLKGEKGNRPLKKGDLYCYAPSNPIEVRENYVTNIEVPCYPKNDRELFANSPQIISDKFKSIETLANNVTTGIKGRITDQDGKPVRGILVLAYRALKPVFLTYYISHGTEYWAETNATGSYFIPVDASGDYYLVARNTLGDGPHKGELFGLFNGNSRHAVTYEKGKLLDNVDITVSKIMDEPVKGVPVIPITDILPAASASASPAGNVTMIGDNVIDKDTIWTGEVLVKGVVLVKKGATLTLEPGTTIRFAWIDRDNNGVGDGEIRVEGRIIAKGTWDKRIVFTSAEAKPKTRDWSYIHLLASQSDNLFEYCRFEFGFSGIQTHYSRGRIIDSIFADNYEGLHFNTSDVTADHNTFVKNGSAFRFKRLEGNVVISNNVIRGNEIGVLFGRQQINAVDFKELNKPVDYPIFLNNNFYGNDKYNFSMGSGQNLDIGAASNWWGSKDAALIEETIFDKKSDNSLGSVIYQPFLGAPVQDAGVRELAAPVVTGGAGK